jgi:aldehyde dehydrogenase (NAD+)
MENERIDLILREQKDFFASGKTLDIKYRLGNLKKLRRLILEHEQEIKDALWTDLHKPEFEVLVTETRFVIKELNLTIRRLRKWAGKRRVWTPIVHFITHSYVIPEPLGQVLILSPWNFPFQLSFMPLIGALAAGNCAIVKVSRQAPATTSVMEKILANFPGELVTFMNGDHSISEYLLSYKFDYIFFTGSTKTGRYVMQKAAENLIPVSLELGGKNPCVVAEDAKLDFAAKRIAWGKFMNAGQTCICPDYVLVHNNVKKSFLELIKKEIGSFYGKNPEESPSFGRIINSGNIKRLSEMSDPQKVVAGGNWDPESCYFAPTVLADVLPGDSIMKEEIFGPILPLIGFNDLDEVYNIIERNPKPLAVYIFTRRRKLAEEFLRKTASGSAGINDTVIQIASPYLPYGGIGSSGTGRYHGKKSFETFSNLRSVIVKSNLLDFPVRYPPYNSLKGKVIKLLMR